MVDNTHMARLMITNRDGYSDEAKLYSLDGGILNVECPPMSGAIIKDIKNQV